MKCISCETEINPKWKHALEQNICPYCGGSIMEELLKGLLSLLQDTMQKMQEYPDQLNDWMLSNYNYIKTDSLDLITYVPKEALKEVKKEFDADNFDRKKKTIKVKVDDGKEVEVETEKIQSDSKTAGFFERAEIIKRGSGNEDEGSGDLDPGDEGADQAAKLQPTKPNRPKAFKSATERTEYLKGLKKKIEIEAKGQGGIVGQESLAAMIDPDAEVSSEDIAMISSGDIISSGLVGSPNLDDEDATTKRVLSMNLALASRNDANNTKGQDGGYNEKDARALQNLVDKAKGNSMGGGFSRSG
jgi:hypothetical protein